MTAAMWSPDAAADPVAEALGTWMRTCAQAGWRPGAGSGPDSPGFDSPGFDSPGFDSPGFDREVVDVPEALGRSTAEPVRALWSVPACRLAAMDGIAVRAAQTSGATAGSPVRLVAAQFDPVDTGDPLPTGRDAVVMREHVRFSGSGTDLAAEVETAVVAGRHVRQVAEDMRAGEVLLPAGHRLRPVDVAALAGGGHRIVRVIRRPVVAILPTGDEVRPVGTVLAPGEVIDTNSLMLAGLVERAGAVPIRLPIAPDDPAQLATLVSGATASADVLLVIAGSSAGRDDHTATVVRRLGRVAVHGVAIRPGHPVLLGVLSGHLSGPLSGAAERPVPVVGVPGYPASAERAFTSFVRPLLRRLSGVPAPEDTVGQDTAGVRLGCAVSSAAHRDETVRLRLARIADPRTGRESVVAVPLRGGSGALSALTQAEAILPIPVGCAGYPAGCEVPARLVGGAVFAGTTTVVHGHRSPATERLVDLARRPLARGCVQWIESGARAAAGALATGLCHAAAFVLAAQPGQCPRQGPGECAGHELGALRDTVDLIVIEMARPGTGSVTEVLAVPSRIWDTPPIMALRAALGDECRPAWAGNAQLCVHPYGDPSGDPSGPNHPG